jgi:hypothetical protein
MVKGDTYRNMTSHFQQIIDRWEGKECTHVQITETLDDNGQIIDQSETTTEIIGIIAPIGLDDIHHAMGILEPEDMYGFFWHSAGIKAAYRVSGTQMRHDHIIYAGTEYNVDRIMETAYDLDIPVFDQFLLRLVAV